MVCVVLRRHLVGILGIFGTKIDLPLLHISPRLEIQPIQYQNKKKPPPPMLEWLMDNLLRCKQDKEVKEQNCNRRNSLPMQSRPYHYGLATSSSSREQQRRSATKTENPICDNIIDNNRICQGDIRTVTVSQSLIRQHAIKKKRLCLVAVQGTPQCLPLH